MRARPGVDARSTSSGDAVTVPRVAAPTSLQAIAMGARAVRRSPWLAAPGALVGFMRWALWWPAPLFALGIARAGLEARLSQGAEGAGAAMSGALRALTAPRSLAILAGLWLAGLLAGGALRVAWLAGALPTLGGTLACEGAPRPRFAEGLAYGFGPLLGTALAGFALESAAQLVALAGVAAVVAVGLHRTGGSAGVALAGLGAFALTVAVVLPLGAALVADAALARTALAGDAPLLAMRRAGGRVLLRPGAFLFSSLAVWLAGLAIAGSVEAVGAAALGVTQGAPALLVAGPRLMASALAATLAAMVELWRVATVAALACGEEG